MKQLRKCFWSGASRRFRKTEDINEAIVISEMADTPPGSQATACCSKDRTGTWENLCLPSNLVSILYSDCRFTGTR
ncbi:MAG: hypothetical protein ACMUIU_14635 [bacterium]